MIYYCTVYLLKYISTELSIPFNFSVGDVWQKEFPSKALLCRNQWVISVIISLIELWFSNVSNLTSRVAELKLLDETRSFCLCGPSRERSLPFLVQVYTKLPNLLDLLDHLFQVQCIPNLWLSLKVLRWAWLMMVSHHASLTPVLCCKLMEYRSHVIIKGHFPCCVMIYLFSYWLLCVWFC